MADEPTSLPPNLLPETVNPPTTPSAAWPAQAGRYQIEGEIARGGMGVVLRASDPDFGRTLAVKVLLDHRQSDAAAVRRFLDEARLCGQLQHPGIPPVHEIGTLPDGRPFFAMKLVRGDTLSDLLARRTHLSEDLPRLLGIFEQVCQTVAYAHSRGVLHRDLKPANVMVGAFGEVQVMDWGLAKMLGSESETARTGILAEASTLYTERGPGAADRTAPGSILGTPAFMPPEQARGQVEHLDERADVFALGAVLCVILTGRPPYESGSRPVVKQAADGDLSGARTRLENCGAEGELVRLALACLSFQPSERPRDAAAVAQAVAAYRAGVEERWRQAEIARAQAEVRVQEERRRRRVLLALVASVVLFVTAVVGAAWWWQRDRDARLARTRAEASPALSRAAQWREEARTVRGRSVTQAEKAAALLRQVLTAVEQAESALAAGLADDTLRREVTEARTAADTDHAGAQQRLAVARKEAAFLAALEQARERGAIWTKEGFDNRGSSTEYARAFAAYGRDVERGSEAEAAAWLRGLPEDVRETALIALYHWWDYCPDPKLSSRLWRVLERADEDPWRRRLQQALQQQKPGPVLQLAQEAKSRGLPAVGYQLLAGSLVRRGRRVEAIELLRGVRLTHPRDFWVPFDLAGCLRQGIDLNSVDEAVSFWGACLDSRGKNVNGAGREEAALEEAVGCYRTALALRPDSTATLNNLGNALQAQNKVEEAIAAYRQALAIDREFAPAHNNLGAALQEQNKVEEAIAAYRRAIACDPTDAKAHYNLGNALQEQHKWKEAIAAYRQALAIDPEYAPAPSNLGAALLAQHKVEEAIIAFRRALTLNPKLAPAHNNLGNALKAQNKLVEAIAAYRQAIALNPRFASAHNNLGVVLQAQNKVEEAIAAYRQAIALNPRFASAHNGLGLALQEQHKVEEAIAAYRQAIASDPKDAKAHYNLGNALQAQNKAVEAIAAYRQAIALNPRLAPAHNNLGLALQAQNKVVEAIVAYRQAIACDPKLANAHYNLGLTLQAQHQMEDAIAAYRQAIALNPRFAKAYSDLGLALKAQHREEEAIAAFRQAIAVDPNYAIAHCNLGLALDEQHKVNQAIAAYRQAIACDPKCALAYHSLGFALSEQNKVEEAIAAYCQAIALNPKGALAHLNLGVALSGQHKVEEAIAAYRQALACDPKHALAHYNLGAALYGQHKLDEAIAAYRQALACDPKLAQAHEALGLALLMRGRFAQARQSTQRCLDLLSPGDPLRRVAAQQLQQCDRYLLLEARVSVILQGEAKPRDATECLGLAEVCRLKQQHATAVRFAAEAFAKEPKRVENLQTALRYNAACDAALAGCRRGEDFPRDEKGCAALRRQAMGWLRADVVLLARQAADGNPRDRDDTVAILRHWQTDPDLVGIRHPWALLRRPADERRAWLQLWTEVATQAR